MTSLNERYQCDPTFRKVTDTVSKGGFADEDGIWYSCVTVGDADLAARIMDCFEEIPDPAGTLYRLRRASD